MKFLRSLLAMLPLLVFALGGCDQQVAAVGQSETHSDLRRKLAPAKDGLLDPDQESYSEFTHLPQEYFKRLVTRRTWELLELHTSDALISKPNEKQNIPDACEYLEIYASGEADLLGIARAISATSIERGISLGRLLLRGPVSTRVLEAFPVMKTVQILKITLPQNDGVAAFGVPELKILKEKFPCLELLDFSGSGRLSIEKEFATEIASMSCIKRFELSSQILHGSLTGDSAADYLRELSRSKSINWLILDGVPLCNEVVSICASAPWKALEISNPTIPQEPEQASENGLLRDVLRRNDNLEYLKVYCQNQQVGGRLLPGSAAVVSETTHLCSLELFGVKVSQATLLDLVNSAPLESMVLNSVSISDEKREGEHIGKGDEKASSADASLNMLVLKNIDKATQGIIDTIVESNKHCKELYLIRCSASLEKASILLDWAEAEKYYILDSDFDLAALQNLDARHKARLQALSLRGSRSREAGRDVENFIGSGWTSLEFLNVSNTTLGRVAVKNSEQMKSLKQANFKKSSIGSGMLLELESLAKRGVEMWLAESGVPQEELEAIREYGVVKDIFRDLPPGPDAG